jgi:regulatory ArsR family protein
MELDTRAKIIYYIQEYEKARAHDLYETLGISKVTVHKQLRRLVDEGILERVGRPPIVFYKLRPATHAPVQPAKRLQLPDEVMEAINDNFLSVSPDGNLYNGLLGFDYWVKHYKKQTPFEELAWEYVTLLREQQKLRSPGGWIEATDKIKQTFTQTSIGHLLFADIYSYRTFGRTKLAKMVTSAKQVGSRKLTARVGEMVKPLISRIIQTYEIEAVGFIPPTVPRPVQFMDELERCLQLPLPTIELMKFNPGDIPVPQKSLNSLEERIVNARETIYTKRNTQASFRNVLLIDDVVGSGASFNETAKKLRAKGIAMGDIIAFGLVGNLKGYDVVREI